MTVLLLPYDTCWVFPNLRGSLEGTTLVEYSVQPTSSNKFQIKMYIFIMHSSQCSLLNSEASAAACPDLTTALIVFYVFFVSSFSNTAPCVFLLYYTINKPHETD